MKNLLEFIPFLNLYPIWAQIIVLICLVIVAVLLIFVPRNAPATKESSVIRDGGVQAITTGDNSPIFIDNRKQAIEHKILAKVLLYNKPEGDLYVTKVELHSQHTIPNLYLAAHAGSIVEFDVVLQRVGGTMIGHSGKREGYWFTNIPNFGGKYLMVIKTRKPEKISIEYNSG